MARAVPALIALALVSPWSLRVADAASLSHCRALFAEQPQSRETARCFHQVAEAEGGSGPATATLHRIVAERPELPWFVFYMGHLHWSETEMAQDLYRRAVEGFHRDGSAEGEILARVNRSHLLSRLGREVQAREEVERIFDITEASEDPEVRVWGQITVARQLVERGEDLARAYELVRDLAIPASMEDAYSLGRSRLVLLGTVCMEIGRLREARRAFQELVDMAVTRGDRYFEASARYNLAWVAYERLRETPTPAIRDEAIALAGNALAVASEVHHPSVEPLAAWMLGVLTPGTAGNRYLERCYEVAQSANMRSYCLNPLAGKIAAEAPEEAQGRIAESRELAERSGDGFAEVRVWQEAMRVAWLAEPPGEALASSKAALDAIEDLRDRQPRGSPAQAGLFSVWSDDYAWLAGRLLEETGRSLDRDRAVGEAFRVSERMRARALIDWLRRADPDRAAAGPTDPGFAGLDEVRDALGPDEALLSFQVAPWEDLTGDFGGGSWLLAITRQTVGVYRLPGRVELRRAVELFEGLIERRDGSEADPAVHLYRKLLALALEELPAGIDRLILIPDDALHRIPFAALRPTSAGTPLGSRLELVRAPSATLWLRWRQAGAGGDRVQPEHPLLVLADPELSGKVREDGVKVARVRDVPEYLGRLPHARREARAALRALGGGLLLTGSEASEGALVGLDLRKVGMLHFAAHAVSDEDRPERSAVLLAPGDGLHDGRLQSAEIAGLDFRGRTVVLASCRSASGTVLRGEGVMSLARAFFQGGAHGVVASLWPLRDDESAAQFGRFYRRLAEGGTVTEALLGVRREAIAAGEPAAAWAGLVVLGNGSAAPVPRGRASGTHPARLWAVLTVAVAVLGLTAWLVNRRLRSRRRPGNP